MVLREKFAKHKKKSSWAPGSIFPSENILWLKDACKQSTLALISFLKHRKYTTNLLFWVLWACLISTIKIRSTNLLTTLTFFFMKKVNFIFHFTLKIFQRYCQLVILDILDRSLHTHEKLRYQFEEKFNFYLHANNQLHLSFLSWDFVKTMQSY